MSYDDYQRAIDEFDQLWNRSAASPESQRRMQYLIELIEAFEEETEFGGNREVF
jgi:hypothetical protein